MLGHPHSGSDRGEWYVTVKTELRELEQGMDSAESYQDWLDAAHAHDELTGHVRVAGGGSLKPV